MNTLDKNDISEIIKLIKPILWDYEIDPYEFYLAATGEIPSAGHFDSKKAFVRILDRMFWYDLVKIFGLEFIKTKLTPEIIAMVRNSEMRENYEFIRKVLHKEPLPLSGWDPSYREKVRHSLLSDRWHRIKQGIL
ncbi:MAG TPA: hypothetical protein PKK26_12020 [Candidatus Wallbacteria bacterium]|nr:hypothetical protein [Candidatus Wallbacteria bacterium]